MMRGSAKLLIMKVLESGEMHGYEVGKAISQIFNNLYEPSPGIIYPNLQWLADGGYLRGTSKDGKTVYGLTSKGKEYLKENRRSIDRVISFGEGKMDQEGRPILRSALRLGATVRSYAPEMDSRQRAMAAEILDEARERISQVVTGGDRRRRQ